MDCHVATRVLKISPIANGHVAQGSGESMHEAPHAPHEGEEESSYGKGRHHVGSLSSFLSMSCRHPSWIL